MKAIIQGLGRLGTVLVNYTVEVKSCPWVCHTFKSYGGWR